VGRGLCFDHDPFATLDHLARDRMSSIQGPPWLVVMQHSRRGPFQKCYSIGGSLKEVSAKRRRHYLIIGRGSAAESALLWPFAVH
jgi:hypothetical protein